MRIVIQFVIWLLIMFLGGVPLNGNNPQERYMQENLEQRNFDQTSWKQAKEGIDYSADRKKKEKKKERKDAENEREARPAQRSNPGISFGQGAATAILKFLIIGGGIIILVVILRSLLGFDGRPRNRKLKEEETSEKINIEQIEEDLHESDLGAFIQQALQQEDYPLAIRLYYLAALKELSLQKLIKWKKDKTNKRYLLEMRNSPHFEHFSQITKIFERIWYGKSAIKQVDFQQIEPAFKQFIKRINRST